MKLLIMPLILLGLVSCASIHEGDYASEIGKNTEASVTTSGLRVSGSELVDLSSKHFAIFDLTFENTTNKWVSIEDVKVEFNDKKLNKLIKIPIGPQLQVWAVAARQNKEINDHNAKMIAASIAGLSSLVTISSSRTDIQNLGQLGLASSVASLSFQQLHAKIKQLERSKMVPENHILSQPFLIAPGLHTKKFFTIYLENPLQAPYLRSIRLNYKVKGQNENERIEINLREMGSFASEFQKLHKDNSAYKKR